MQERFRLVTADAYHCQYNGGMDKLENNPVYFEKDPKKGLNWFRNLPQSSSPEYLVITVSRTLPLQSPTEQLVT